MAEPGDHDDHDDHDDQIGFASAAALTGRTREPVAPVQTESEPLPAWAVETPVAAPPQAPSTPRKAFGRAASGPVALPEGAVSLFAVYVLILFAVPTLGASALLALAAVLTRPSPEQDLAASHYTYQKRTLLAAAGVAVLGVLLIVINLGVFVLFTMAVWVMARGAVGVFRLKAGQPIPRPLSWWM